MIRASSWSFYDCPELHGRYLFWFYNFEKTFVTSNQHNDRETALLPSPSFFIDSSALFSASVLRVRWFLYYILFSFFDRTYLESLSVFPFSYYENDNNFGYINICISKCLPCVPDNATILFILKQINNSEACWWRWSQSEENDPKPPELYYVTLIQRSGNSHPRIYHSDRILFDRNRSIVQSLLWSLRSQQNVYHIKCFRTVFVHVLLSLQYIEIGSQKTNCRHKLLDVFKLKSWLDCLAFSSPDSKVQFLTVYTGNISTHSHTATGYLDLDLVTMS